MEWQESARLWVALIGPVSAMKSPMLKAVAKPLQAIDNVLAAQAQLPTFEVWRQQEAAC